MGGGLSSEESCFVDFSFIRIPDRCINFEELKSCKVQNNTMESCKVQNKTLESQFLEPPRETNTGPKNRGVREVEGGNAAFDRGLVYSQLSLNEHLFKTDTFCWSLPFSSHFTVT